MNVILRGHPRTATAVLEQAQQDLLRVPCPDAPDMAAANWVSGSMPLDAGAECTIDVKGDPLLEELFLAYVHRRRADARLPYEAVVVTGRAEGDARSEAGEAGETLGNARHGTSWPDGSDGMALNLAQLAGLPMGPRDALVGYSVSRDVFEADIGLPGRTDLRARLTWLLAWIDAQGGADVCVEGKEPTPRQDWVWTAVFSLPRGVTGRLRLLKFAGMEPRLGLRLESADFQP